VAIKGVATFQRVWLCYACRRQDPLAQNLQPKPRFLISLYGKGIERRLILNDQKDHKIEAIKDNLIGPILAGLPLFSCQSICFLNY
jgi:hypothetical protein